MFLGMKIERLASGAFTLSQKHYIEKMASVFAIDSNSKPVDTPSVLNHQLTVDMCPRTVEEEKAAKKLPFQALVGSLIYATKTRPDIAFAVSDVARFMSNWGVGHYTAAMRVLRYLYHTRDFVLTIDPSNDLFSLSVYCDANYGDGRDSGEAVDDKWKSQGGYMVFLNDVLVSWRSRRHKCRALSSMEAEYFEASEAAKEILWFRGLMHDLGYAMNGPSHIYEDNKACISYSKNNTCHDRTKHIDIRAYNLRDNVRAGLVALLHIDTKQQLADMLTKTQTKKLFFAHRAI